MVTVIDPYGTPEPVYSRSGVTIHEMNASGSTFGTAAPIIATCGWTVVIVHGDDNPTKEAGVILPDDAEVGDVVEIYCGTSLAEVYAPTGETIQGNVVAYQIGQNDPGVLFRKTAAALWRYVR